MGVYRDTLRKRFRLYPDGPAFRWRHRAAPPARTSGIRLPLMGIGVAFRGSGPVISPYRGDR